MQDPKAMPTLRHFETGVCNLSAEDYTLEKEQQKCLLWSQTIILGQTAALILQTRFTWRWLLDANKDVAVMGRQQNQALETQVPKLYLRFPQHFAIRLGALFTSPLCALQYLSTQWR